MIDGILTLLRAFDEFSATKNKCVFLVFLVKDDDLQDLEGKVINQYGIKGVHGPN